ncbi:unnamed protein product [Mytilus coruscus]|uniref:Endonuclease/exonuclease/phosphatase domain-containing protein n=1 Tax=Mytilus coruscus TaxID=42192 RepID=A0A6J8A2F9_MYTCO|nr:unnamed protein product [Mytilus coruscus]
MKLSKRQGNSPRKDFHLQGPANDEIKTPKSANNRYFGGLGIFDKNTILPGIEILKNTSLDYQWVKLDKKFFNFAKNILLCLAYIIPASSSYIFQSDDDPLATIEKDIINYFAERGHIVLCGDLNARTGSELDFIENDTYDPFAMDDEEYEYDIGLQKRKSCDNKTDARDKQLLQLRILNGRMLGDSNGNFTCFKPNGTSVVDYIIMSEDLIQHTLNCKVSNFIPCFSDCHCRFIMYAACLILSCFINKNESTQNFPGKFKWTDCSKEKFQDALCHPTCKLDINAFLTNDYQDKSNINSAATDLQNIIIKAARMSLKFKSNQYKKKTVNKKQWYDQDLYNKKRELNIKAKHMSENPYNINIRNNYFKHYRKFRKLKKYKRREFKSEIVKQLDNLLTKNPKEYWNLVNKLKGETEEARDAPEISINNTTWTKYFQDLNSLSDTNKSKINLLNKMLVDLEKENMSNVLDYKIRFIVNDDQF